MRLIGITGRFAFVDDNGRDSDDGTGDSIEFRIDRGSNGAVRYFMKGGSTPGLSDAIEPLLLQFVDHSGAYLRELGHTGGPDLTKQAVATLAAYFKVSEDVIEQAAADAQLTVEG